MSSSSSTKSPTPPPPRSPGRKQGPKSPKAPTFSGARKISRPAIVLERQGSEDTEKAGHRTTSGNEDSKSADPTTSASRGAASPPVGAKLLDSAADTLPESTLASGDHSTLDTQPISIETPGEEDQTVLELALDFSQLEPRQFTQKSDPNACLFVASLSSSRTEEQLHASVTRHFEPYGPLLHVKVLSDWANRPYAFVQFEKSVDADRALIEAHNSILDGRRIRIERAKVNRTLFLAKFSKYATQQEIKSILERFGPIEDLTILQNFQTGQSKGCGFVKFRFREDAIHAFMSLRSHSKWVVEWAANLDKSTVELDKCSVFVGGLAPSVTEPLLRERFERYGAIHELQLINRGSESYSHDGKTSFAFIQYSNEDAALRSVEAENGTDWMSQILRVQLRETSESRMRRHASAPPTMMHRQRTPSSIPAPIALMPMPEICEEESKEPSRALSPPTTPGGGVDTTPSMSTRPMAEMRPDSVMPCATPWMMVPDTAMAAAAAGVPIMYFPISTPSGGTAPPMPFYVPWMAPPNCMPGYPMPAMYPTTPIAEQEQRVMEPEPET